MPGRCQRGGFQLREFRIDALGRSQTFAEFVAEIAGVLERGESLPVRVGAECKRCEYYSVPLETTAEVRSGWSECMAAHFGSSSDIRREQTVFALHRIGPPRLKEILRSQPIELRSVAEHALPAEDPVRRGAISADQRRRLQWQEARGELQEPFILSGRLQMALGEWRWPLHFIDFETSRPALPYHASRTPYHQILFQFSHHVADRDGRIAHRTQHLEATPGLAPSIPVLRALRAALCADNGTVLHWWTHEDTVLKDVRNDVVREKPADADQLIEFVDSMIGTDRKPGRLFDLGKLVSETAFFPGTCGSSSIKRVLPAMLAATPALQQRYAKPVYGTAELPSLNFREWSWVAEQDGTIRDPYLLLNPLFSDPLLQKLVMAAEDGDSAEEPEFIKNGGAAIVAYDQLQNAGLAPSERSRLTTQLLRYCELDTFAMVMVYQGLTGVGLSPGE